VMLSLSTDGILVNTDCIFNLGVVYENLYVFVSSLDMLTAKLLTIAANMQSTRAIQFSRKIIKFQHYLQSFTKQTNANLRSATITLSIERNGYLIKGI
jgi:hypothetical protein